MSFSAPNSTGGQGLTGRIHRSDTSGACVWLDLSLLKTKCHQTKLGHANAEVRLITSIPSTLIQPYNTLLQNMTIFHVRFIQDSAVWGSGLE